MAYRKKFKRGGYRKGGRRGRKTKVHRTYYVSRGGVRL